MRLPSATVLAALLLAMPASAESIDLATIKCKEFMESGKDNIGYVLAWLDGYYRDEDEPAVIDFDRMKANAEKLGAYCAKNPNVGLGAAAEKLFGND